MCARLVKANSERLKQTESTESKAKEMMKLAFENVGKEGEMQIKVIFKNFFGKILKDFLGFLDYF